MAETSTKQTIYSLTWIYHVDPAFHRLPDRERDASKAAFLEALEARDPSVTLRGVYSLAGLRAEADLMLWVWGPDLDALQALAVALRQSGLGRYLTQVEAYVGVVSVPRYDPEHGPAFTTGAPPKKYVSVYPFVKTTEWYLLPYEERRELMKEHGEVGRHYAVPRAKVAELARAARGESAAPTTKGDVNGKGGARAASHAATATATEAEEGGGVLSNTVDSFALGDYEFILANESDDPDELKAMMMALRAVQVRKYTRSDTPFYFGRLRAPADALAEL
ncbi:MAG TPA: chlorite dismutase family protein [Ktedonobacterales bacterium]|nr:chlorite dismutase family protein [Ktedonobacterales bacterium]